MTKMDILTLTLPVDPSYLPAARAFIREVAVKAGLSENDTNKIVLASGEAVSNVIQHAMLPKGSNFDIICDVSPLKLEVIVRDKGYPFSPEKVEKYSVEKVLEGDKPKGLGLFLMKRNVDEMTVVNNGVGGKEVHLVKYIDQKHIKEQVDESKIKLYEGTSEHPQKPKDKIPYRVGLLDAQKAIEVSQCAYRTYGYNYVHEFIYYPERIAEMNASEEIVSAIAVSEKTNEVMSHAALEFKKGIDAVELGVAFTKPECRNQGCFNRICEYLMDIAKGKGVNVVYATAVTIHPFSQKVILRGGFKETGILIGFLHAGMFKDSLERGVQRESAVLLCRNLDEASKKTLYAPEQHEEMLKNIYKNVGVPTEWKTLKKTDKVMLPRKNSVLETKVHSQTARANIIIKEYGSDILREVRHTLRGLERNKTEDSSG